MPIEDMCDLKIDTKFFLKMLNSEQLVDPTPKTLLRQGGFQDTRGCQYIKGRCIEDMKRIASVAATK